MRPEEQLNDPARYVVVPRTLVFLTQGERILLLRGAPDKKLWANRYNGLGGHIEPGEDPLCAALREVQEEAGIIPDRLQLKGLIHITRPEPPGIMLFVFTGTASEDAVGASPEGQTEWADLAALSTLAVVEDLPELLAHILPAQDIVFGRYQISTDGLEIHFNQAMATAASK